MLVKHGATVSDPFAQVGDGEPIPAGPVCVPLKRFLSERDTLLKRNHPLAVRLETQDSPEKLGADVHRLAAVVLHVPHFKDGRAFSHARALRLRLGYKGEIRITGHVLKDQLAFYTRVGADAFELDERLSLDAVAQALKEISQVYQPSADGRLTIRDLRIRRDASLSRL